MWKKIQPQKLRIVFMGTPEFAATTLKKLFEEKYNIIAVFTKPDAKVGRKKELQASPVKILALQHEVSIFQPEKFNSEAIEKLEELKPDLVVVAAYGKILSPKALSVAKLGNLNVHGSLLPKFRGPSPVQNALLVGETETGATIMLMDAGVDTGDILTQAKTAINEHVTAPELMEKIAEMGADLLIKTIPDWAEGKITPTKQNIKEATICQMIDREDGKIFWGQEAREIFNRYRALDGWPGVFTYYKVNNQPLRLKLTKISWDSKDPQRKKTIGEVFQAGEKIAIQTGKGLIILQEVQLEGKKNVDIKNFLNGYPDFLGTILQ